MKTKPFSLIINQIPELIAGIALTIAVAITCTNGLCRYILGFTIPGSDEIVILGFGWAVFLGAAAAYRRKMHMGIDVLVNILPKKNRIKLEFCINVFIVVINAYITYLGFYLAINAWQKIMPATRIPYFFLDMAFVIGFAFMTLYSIHSAYKNFIDLKMQRKGDTA